MILYITIVSFMKLTFVWISNFDSFVRYPINEAKDRLNGVAINMYKAFTLDNGSYNSGFGLTLC